MVDPLQQEDDDIEIEAAARLRLEQEQAAEKGSLTSDGYPNPYTASNIYSAVKDYALPAAQLGVDVGTSFLKPLTGPAGWLTQPIVASSINGAMDNFVRSGGELVDQGTQLFDDIFHTNVHTNLEPGVGYDKINRETGATALKNAGVGVGVGAGATLVGWGSKKIGNLLFNNLDQTRAARGAVFPPGTLTDATKIADADATIAALKAEGVFPPSTSQNPWVQSQSALDALSTREGATLSSLRNKVDAQMTTPFSQKEILQSPSAYERYGKYNNLGEQVPDEMVTFENLLERNSTPELLNMSGIAGRKEGYRRTADSMPLPKTFEGQIYRTFSEAMKDKELELISKLEPEKRAQYLASLKLYGQAQSALPQVEQKVANLAQNVTMSGGPGASYGSQSGIRLFGPLRDFFSDPSGKRLYSKAFNPQSSVAKFLGGEGSRALVVDGQRVMESAGLISNLQPEIAKVGEEVFGAKEVQGQSFDSGPLLSNLTEPKAIAISRNLNQVDAAAIDALIPSYVEDYNAQPLQFQFKRLVAEGDKSKIADFLGQLTSKYPDFPMQRGAVTGLPSEFDLGDGVARLISPIDKSEYERRVNVSELNVMEKAMRIKAIREQGIAHRFDIPLLNDPGPMTSKQPSSGGYQFAPRQQTASGSRKVE